MPKVKEVQFKENPLSKCSREPITFDTSRLIEYLSSCVHEGQTFGQLTKDDIDTLFQINKNHIIKSVIQEITDLYDIKKDIQGWSLTYYTPGGDLEIPPSEFTVGYKVLIQLGGREVYTAVIHQAGRDIDVPQKIVLTQDSAYNLPGRLSQIIKLKCNSKKAENVSARPGHRPIRVKKDPSKRHVLILEGYINPDVFNQMIKEKSGIDIKELSEKLNLPNLSV